MIQLLAKSSSELFCHVFIRSLENKQTSNFTAGNIVKMTTLVDRKKLRQPRLLLYESIDPNDANWNKPNEKVRAWQTKMSIHFLFDPNNYQNQPYQRIVDRKYYVTPLISSTAGVTEQKYVLADASNSTLNELHFPFEFRFTTVNLDRMFWILQMEQAFDMVCIFVCMQCMIVLFFIPFFFFFF